MCNWKKLEGVQVYRGDLITEVYKVTDCYIGIVTKNKNNPIELVSKIPIRDVS